MIGGDEVFCCYTVPYTYSEVLAHIDELRKLHDESAFKFIRFESIGYSLSGINMPILKISNQSPEKIEPEYKPKPVIFIIGRQHCGETHSSFIIHGLINFLCSHN